MSKPVGMLGVGSVGGSILNVVATCAIVHSRGCCYVGESGIGKNPDGRLSICAAPGAADPWWQGHQSPEACHARAPQIEA